MIAKKIVIRTKRFGVFEFEDRTHSTTEAAKIFKKTKGRIRQILTDDTLQSTYGPIGTPIEVDGKNIWWKLTPRDLRRLAKVLDDTGRKRRK